MPSAQGILRNTFENVGELRTTYSNPQVYFNVPWQICLISSREGLGCRLYCCKPGTSNLWSLDVDFRMFFVDAAAEKHEVSSHNCKFEEPSGYGDDKVIGWREAMRDFVVDCKLTVECHVTVKKSFGIAQKRAISFDSPNEPLTDVVLEVAGKTFHVSRVILASNSPVFEAMLLKNFEESRQRSVEIRNVSPHIFKLLLDIVYNNAQIDINDDNVAALLEAADYYAMDRAVGLCTDHLFHSKRILMKQKLNLAERFLLSDFQEKCLKSIQTAAELKKLCSNIEGMGELTVKALLKKAISFI